ncbi:hypothetical protein CHARACLAT_023190 [Characodon lateralis]|uniref:Uncharacterized protein n=1 Tax=Characodon lateralis TaxID=208331 RepID=A0ABU7CR12_9TELE|nr:hypothetical protein [Characodon lateralis]
MERNEIHGISALSIRAKTAKINTLSIFVVFFLRSALVCFSLSLSLSLCMCMCMCVCVCVCVWLFVCGERAACQLCNLFSNLRSGLCTHCTICSGKTGPGTQTHSHSCQISSYEDHLLTPFIIQ